MKRDRRISQMALKKRGAAGWLLALTLCSLPWNAGCRRFAKAKELRTPVEVMDRYGNERTYRLFLPPIPDTAKRIPLLVYFHGVVSPGFKKISALANYTGSPVEETALIPFCRGRGIALLVPDALYEYQFLGCASRGWLIAKEIDGVERIIDAVLEKYPIDGRRVYLAGISAGAAFCHFLANRRPRAYDAIISHSQAYVDEEGKVLRPPHRGPQFGILFCYNQGDYERLIAFCLESERLYREAGYRTTLLKDLPPAGHRWSSANNARFWRWLQKLGRLRNG